MQYSEAAFTLFVKENDTFPYNAVPQTRRMLHPSWILVKSPCHTGAIFRPRNYYVLPSSAINKKDLQVMIMNKSAMPIPKEYDGIIEVMEWWGRSINGNWQQQVFVMLDESMQQSEPMSSRTAMYECLVLLLEEKLRYSWANYQTTVARIENFNTFFTIRMTILRRISMPCLFRALPTLKPRTLLLI